MHALKEINYNGNKTVNILFLPLEAVAAALFVLLLPPSLLAFALPRLLVTLLESTS
jgi:hypothetical protein